MGGRFLLGYHMTLGVLLLIGGKKQLCSQSRFHHDEHAHTRHTTRRHQENKGGGGVPLTLFRRGVPLTLFDSGPALLTISDYVSHWGTGVRREVAIVRQWGAQLKVLFQNVCEHGMKNHPTFSRENRGARNLP